MVNALFAGFGVR